MRIKKMLSKEESLMPKMYSNIRRALMPLMDDQIYTYMKVRPSRPAQGWG